MDYQNEHNRVYLKINQQLKTKYDRLIQNIKQKLNKKLAFS